MTAAHDGHDRVPVALDVGAVGVQPVFETAVVDDAGTGGDVGRDRDADTERNDAEIDDHVHGWAPHDSDRGSRACQALEPGGQVCDDPGVNCSEIERALSGCRFGRRVRHFASIASTNDRALADIDSGEARDGDVYVADLQTRGRGTGDRSWHSEAGGGLWTTVVVEGGSAARPLPFLPAVALADLLHRDFGLPAHLKWPNDVLVEDRKIAGILIEGRSNAARGAAWAVGVGLNLSQDRFPAELAGLATSVRLEGRPAPDRDRVLVALLRRMSLMDAEGLDLVPAFRARCRMIGREVTQAGGAVLRVLDVGPDGHLKVLNADGGERNLVSRSDSVILPGWLDGAPPYGPPPPLV